MEEKSGDNKENVEIHHVVETKEQGQGEADTNARDLLIFIFALLILGAIIYGTSRYLLSPQQSPTPVGPVTTTPTPVTPQPTPMPRTPRAPEPLPSHTPGTPQVPVPGSTPTPPAHSIPQNEPAPTSVTPSVPAVPPNSLKKQLTSKTS